MLPGPVEVAAWVGGMVFTGGVGWWAHYVTGGAAKAHLLAREVESIKAAFVKYEKGEQAQFVVLQQELSDLRESYSGINARLSELHGMVQGLVTRLGSAGQ